MDWLPRTGAALTRVTSVPEPAKRAGAPPNVVPFDVRVGFRRCIPEVEHSGPASPFGDLVKLAAREQLVVLKELPNSTENGDRVGRRQGLLHATLLSRFGSIDRAASSKCGEELLQLQLSQWCDIRKAKAHARGRGGGG